MDRNFPFSLFGERISHGFTRFYGFRSGYDPPCKKQMLKKGGFTGPAMTGDGYISDLIRGVAHGALLRLI
jgi:hypothetical protein